MVCANLEQPHLDKLTYAGKPACLSETAWRTTLYIKYHKTALTWIHLKTHDVKFVWGGDICSVLIIGLLRIYGVVRRYGPTVLKR